MLNLRKLKQDFSSNVLKEGKELYEKNKVLAAKILHLDATSLRISAQVLGQYKNTYASEIEIDRVESETIDSDCDCPYHYDCQHLAALLFYLEANLDQILVHYSQENDLEDLTKKKGFDEEQKKKLLKAVKEAASKEEYRRDKKYRRELLQEYVEASKLLAGSSFFLPEKKQEVEKAQLAIIFHLRQDKKKAGIDIQLALRLACRSKPLHIPNIKDFWEKVRYRESLTIGGRSYLLALDSFSGPEREIAQIIMDHSHNLSQAGTDRGQKMMAIDSKVFGMVLATACEIASQEAKEKGWVAQSGEQQALPCLYEGNLESSLYFSPTPAQIKITLEYIHPPTSKILLNPTLLVDDQSVTIEDVLLFECATPGFIHNHIYYRFSCLITRQHLKSLLPIRDMTIPEPLFGTFVENALPELARFALVDQDAVTEHFTTLPYVGDLEALCDISFLDGELEASLSFCYDEHIIPAASKKLKFENIHSFVTEEGVVARNLVEEKAIIEDLFRDFIFNPEHQTYVARTEKKIIDFMTDIIPHNQHRVKFNCPQNLLDQFIYDKTSFTLKLSHLDRMDCYQMEVQVKGALKGVTIDRLWDCLISRHSYIELGNQRKKTRKAKEKGKLPKILVLDLKEMGKIVQLFDELGIEKLDDHILQRPLWSLANIDAPNFKDLPVTFSMTKQLREIRGQMLGTQKLKLSDMPKEIRADLRPYQREGAHWLERLRSMYLSGILADDMGLGKTLQAIIALTQYQKVTSGTSLVVCPTSLLYNWAEEFHKFNPKLGVMIVDGMPNQRKKLIAKAKNCDVVITSYSLLQKDIDSYRSITFSYMVLDEAQHIKNRGTRNAKSAKMVKAKHRMILSGTPIENSLDELWSLFDFLMPGFLGSYDRFIEKYVRPAGEEQMQQLQYLRKKVAPFIMRRMKTDVLADLPSVAENVYHTQLTDMQRDLYRSYAESARDELTKLVEQSGFDKVQIHVLATLTRLKQICCHPAIFAKEKPEPGDSAKYEMLLELLRTLIEGKHKVVIFSQYTQMLKIMRDDFERENIRFSYLDGSSKNRLEIVKSFNRDASIPVFLVSLKAGGTGLNLVGADTVIHYDMWWNPAVENQATDRVHRIGQTNNVSVYKLVTLGTIEEKIVEMQQRKKGIVKKIVSCDDEAITKLTWEDVLELLQT
ncbi:MAG: SNF2-related protein [Chlamydiota bacterium]